MDHEPNLRSEVYRLMRQLPNDKVTTYGDLAAMAGSPRAARIVGGIANQGPDDLPWHRLVNSKGGVAIGFPGGQEVQKLLLESDGIVLDDEYCIVDFGAHRWQP